VLNKEGVRRPLLASTREICDTLEECYRDAAAHPSPYGEHFRRVVANGSLKMEIVDILRLVRMSGIRHQGKDVLEAGCGYGLPALVFCLLGARHVEGIDVNDAALRAFNLLLALRNDLFERVRAGRGDVAALDYPNLSFDMVYSIEAVSHYRKVRAFLKETARVLRPGGVLVISDCNNGANPIIRKRNHDLWDLIENGPEGAQFRGETIGKPYVELRRELIQRFKPDLAPDVPGILARRTSGMGANAVIDAVRAYVSTGQLPNSVYRKGTCPLNPMLNAVRGRLFHPVELCKEIEAHGFDVRVRSHFGGRRSRIVAFLDWLQAPLPARATLRAAWGYKIFATKKH